MSSGEEVVACGTVAGGVDAATCAAAGNRLMPAKPKDSNKDNGTIESGMRTEDR